MQNATEDVKEPSEKEHGPMVTITINGISHEIHRGRQAVATLKTLGQVSDAYDLVQIVDGQPIVLPDDSHVTIKGGEVFIGQPRSCGSSY
jgi:hypothetical protein